MADIILTFLISVVAGVVSYYICKWLDRDKKGSNSLNGIARRKEQENPRGLGPSGVFVCATWNSHFP